MSSPKRMIKRSRTSVPKKILSVLYWIIFAISLVIVLGFLAFKIFITPPKTGSNQVVKPPVILTGNLGNRGEDPTPDDPTDDPPPAENSDVIPRAEGVYTCVLVGTDDGNGCADTIMLGVFDTNNDKATLISVPRDTLVQIKGGNSKINAAYGIGGVPLICELISDMLALPIDYYVSVDLAAFEAIVDQIGGVWFDVPVDMDYKDPAQDLYIQVKAGYQLLDGHNALGVVRCRNCYPSADIGRTQTQRKFLAALVKQTISVSNVTKVTSLIKTISRYVDSNMPLEDMIYFATQAIGMDMEADLTSEILPNDWIAPVIELRDQEVLELVNSLGVYNQDIPLDALNIRHRS